MFENIINIVNSDLTNEEKLNQLYDYHDNDLALALEQMDTETRITFYALFDDTRLSDIISYLDEPAKYLEEMGLEQAADVIEEMDSDDAVDILEELEEEHKDKILELVEDEALEDIQLIQSYDEDEVGSLMTTNYVVVSKDSTVKQAMNSLVKQAGDNDNFNLIYVVDNNNKFYGTVELRDLFVARADTPFEDIIKTTYPKFHDKELVSDAYPILTDYDLASFPVLNDQEELIGVITSSDIIELIGEELEEDFAKLGGLTGNVDEKTNIFKSVSKRLPWLIILLVLGVFISLVISSFENVVKALPVIVFFQSIVLGMSGNVGTQSLAVTIRYLSDEKITSKDLFIVLFKEIRVGFLNGVILAVISSLIVGSYIYLFDLQISTQVDNSPGLAFMVSGVIGLSLICSMTLSAFAGTIIPIIFKKLHIDPAVASGPFITTVNDIVAVITYYGLAWLLIIGLVL